MNILLDFGAIKGGGGAQLGVNFLERLERDPWPECKISLVMPEAGPLSRVRLSAEYEQILISPNAYSRRILFEYIAVRRALKKNRIDKIFTFFGAGLPHPARIHSLVTVAYPIICYSDSQYWRYLDWRYKVRLRLLNYMRRRRLQSASRIIAETDVMKKRLARVLSCPESKIVVIPPAPSEYVELIPNIPERGGKCFLFISGNDQHKNLWRLQEVARRLLEKGVGDFFFLLTLSKEQYLTNINERRLTSDPSISERFQFLGAIEPKNIMDAYRRADYVVSLSDLESFSNNYMEAWKVGIPLIASDRDFAHAICGDSAIYAEPHDTEDVANKLCLALSDAALRRRLVERGAQKLRAMQSQGERFLQVMQEIVSFPVK